MTCPSLGEPLRSAGRVSAPVAWPGLPRHAASAHEFGSGPGHRDCMAGARVAPQCCFLAHGHSRHAWAGWAGKRGRDSANGHAHGPPSPAALDKIAGAVGIVCVRGELLGAYAYASAGSSEARQAAQVPTTPCSALRPLRMPLAPRPWSAQAAACCLPHTAWRPSRSASAWLCAAPALPCAAPAMRSTAPAQRCSSPRAARCAPRRLARRQQRTNAHEGRALTQHCASQELDVPTASGGPALQVACCPCRLLRSCRHAGAQHAYLALTAS